MAKETSPYTLTFKLGDTTQTKKGDTIVSCLRKMKDPKLAKSAGVFLVEYRGQKSKTTVKLNPTQLQRVFAKPLEMDLFAKRLEILL